MSSVAKALFKGDGLLLKDMENATLKKNINSWLNEYVYIIPTMDLSRWITPKLIKDRNTSRFCIVANSKGIEELINSVFKVVIPAISPTKDTK